MSIGCCGSPRPVSIAALVARADSLPGNTPRGQRARLRLAYTIAAGKAAQVGNRSAYSRAMSGLRGLGDEGGSALTTHGTATDAAIAAAPQIQATLSSLVSLGGSGASAALGSASSYINIVLGLVSVGTAIGGAAGGDADAIRVVNMIVSWVRTLLNGTQPTIPTLDAATVRGLIAFCAFKDLVSGMVTAAFQVGISAASEARNAGGVTALTTLNVWIVGILDGICGISQISAAAQEQARRTRCAQLAPGAIPGIDDACVCPPGTTAGNCLPDGTHCSCVAVTAPTTTAPSGPIMLSPAQRRAILSSRSGTPLTTAQQSLLRLIPVTMVPGTLDPVTLCAPGELSNPCSGICDGGRYAGMTCVNGVPTKSGGSAIAPLAIGAAALWFLFK